MKSLIQMLIYDENISNNHAEGIEEFYKNKSRNDDYMKYKFGSNYIPAEIAMSMKKEENNSEFIVSIDYGVDDSGNEIQECNQKFKRIWTLHIYPCQKFYLFGTKMYAVPYFQVRRSRMLWVVSYLLFHVETLWDIISKSEMRRSE